MVAEGQSPTPEGKIDLTNVVGKSAIAQIVTNAGSVMRESELGKNLEASVRLLSPRLSNATHLLEAIVTKGIAISQHTPAEAKGPLPSVRQPTGQGKGG